VPEAAVEPVEVPVAVEEPPIYYTVRMDEEDTNNWLNFGNIYTIRPIPPSQYDDDDLTLANRIIDSILLRNSIRNFIGRTLVEITDIEEIAAALYDTTTTTHRAAVLTAEEIEQVAHPIIYKDVVAPKNTACPFLLTDYEPDDEVIQIGCGHLFTKEPLYKWFSDCNTICPICRHDTTKDL
jgi:hypothetical protein